MASDTGAATRDTTRTAIAVLTVLGFIFIAAVLPAVGTEAPGAGLFGEQGQGDQGALESLLQGQQGGAGQSGGVVEGLFDRVSDGSGSNPLSGLQGGSGGGSGQSAFGALNPGSRTGVGSQGSPLSESLRNQSSIPHMVVQSPESTYWRTEAYGVYTGSGWETRGEPEQRVFPLPVTGSREGRQEIEQEIQLLRPASSLPAAWEVTNVRGIDQNRLRVTDRGGIQTESRVPANTTYRAISRAPPRDPARLREGGTDYPDEIRQRYATLPDSTPDRVTEFTTELTSDADTPFETAQQIEQWLESNRDYSLDATHSGGDVAAQFIFEMDAGYCEYFATSMVVMLRSQGIPARYAVGYSTGEPQGNDTYIVRAMNAHAWVEVYFPETGWVRFDPTPGQDRLSQESQIIQQAMNNGSAESVANRFLDQADEGSSFQPQPNENDGGEQDDTSGDGSDNESGNETDSESESDSGSEDSDSSGEETNPYNHTEQGSPGESFDSTGGPSYAIEILTDPVPGQQVTVEVTRNEQPAANVVVTFNGQRVGTTNSSGMVTSEVPFERQLIVGVVGTDDDTASSVGLLVADQGALGPRGAGVATRQDNGTEGSTTRSFTVPTDVNVTVEGALEPGGTATARATINERPVRDATVFVDGQAVGTTDDSGEATVQLPTNETTTISVQRGDASGNKTLQLANLSVSVSGFALPGLSVTVTVTDGGEPVEDATVAVVDGDTSATTGADGTASLSLPMATGVSIRTITPAGVTKTRPIALQFLAAGFGFLFTVTVVGVLVRLRRQAASAGRSIGAQLVASLRWLSGAGVGLLVKFAVVGERVLGQIPTLARAITSRLRAGVALLVAAIREGDLGKLPGPGAIVAWILGVLRGVGSGIGTSIPTPASGGGDSAGTGSMPEPAGDTLGGGPTARERVREAWRRFRERLSVSDYEHRTPGELARTAIEEGHAEREVKTLTGAFRAIEYGERDANAYVEDAVAACERLVEGASREEEPAVADGGDES